MADGPHGVRFHENCNVDNVPSEKDSTCFPSLSLLASTFDKEMAFKYGEYLGRDCVEMGVDLILGPGLNIKRLITCGRNFEYMSEDPVLAGEMAAGYVNGAKSVGIATCPKHYVANNQEEYRIETSVDIDERTLREIYLKPFEIMVKKSHPQTIMSSYNKINSIWASENKFIYDILKDEWGFDGVVVSDWGAVHNMVKSVASGLDYKPGTMPTIIEEFKNALAEGEITMQEIDNSAKRVLKFLLTKKPKKLPYDREKQHEVCREIASAGAVLLKNNNKVLPITKEKYKKITLVGEYAVNPLYMGQGSAEVFCNKKHIENPYDELKKSLKGVEVDYYELYKKSSFVESMIWAKSGEFIQKIKDSDLVVFFTGSMTSEDTEQFDRLSAKINPNHEYMIRLASKICGKKVVVVMQSGGGLILGQWNDYVDGVVQAWLGGEASGGAISDVLTGKVNPSGKLSETFPTKMRADLEYPGNGVFVEYKEKLDVGYRYYDKHTDEVVYPFGHGLSYTTFEYSKLNLTNDKDNINITFNLKNTGEVAGSEVVQVYVQDVVSTMVKPIKELKAFEKIYLEKGEEKVVNVVIPVQDIASYNIMLKKWVVENGVYNILVGSSCQDIRLKGSIEHQQKMPYTMTKINEPRIG